MTMNIQAKLSARQLVVPAFVQERTGLEIQVCES